MTTHRGEGGNQGTDTAIPTGVESKEMETPWLFLHPNFHQCSLPQSTQVPEGDAACEQQRGTESI